MFDPNEYIDDSRGGSIERFEITHADGHTVAMIRGPQVIADQIRAVYERRGLEVHPLGQDDRPEWTHAFSIPPDLAERFQRALEFYSEILVVPSSDPLRSVIALGFYKQPEPGTNPLEWPNAPAGDMVHKAKYHKSAEALESLVDKLVKVIKTHPWYASGGELIVSTPGHNASEPSFSPKLAAAIADAAGLPIVAVNSLTHVRKPAKESSRAELDLAHQFAVDGDVTGKVVILVDDVYMTGRTMNNVAAVLKDSGARLVLGLVGARTLRVR